MWRSVKQLGQVFTPDHIVSQMLSLCKNKGRVLEPSCGNGAFSKNITNRVAIELDPIYYTDDTILNMDFFDYPLKEKFDTIIGNPPYVRYQDILPQTKAKLSSALFNKRSNLYLFFIEKCIKHLNDKGELIFITPRDFLKATSSVKLNKFIFDNGTITDLIDLGDKSVFKGFNPNCVIFRFEKGNFDKKTNVHVERVKSTKEFVFSNGQLLFVTGSYSVNFNDVFFVKVGAVSGNDAIFTSEEHGNMDFVCSFTFKTGKTKRMIFNKRNKYLTRFKDELLNRRIRRFNQNNWWEWGRSHYESELDRIYVNSKIRDGRPFFTHPCKDYDGSVLAIFPKDRRMNIEILKDKLNDVNWRELGFVCDGRYLFSQRSLENSLLPFDFIQDALEQSSIFGNNKSFMNPYVPAGDLEVRNRKVTN